MQTMNRTPQRAPDRACLQVLALATAAIAWLGWAVPAHAQVALPQVVAPVTSAVPAGPQTLPQLPSTLANGTGLPAVQLPLPLPQQVPALQTPAVQQILQAPAAVPTGPLPLAVPAAPTLTTAPALATSSAGGVTTRIGAEGVRGLVPLQQLRAHTVRDLLRQRSDVLEADPLGEPVRRQELLWVSPKPDTLKSALALGFAVLREHNLPELGLQEVVMRPPPGMATAHALAQLRALAPDVEADFNHIYTRSGEVAVAPAAARNTLTAARRVGLVDGGVDRQHAALRGATVHAWGCGAVPHPSAHGTAVASLLVGRETAFAGSATGTTLYAADIYCGQPADGAVEAIALALAWMARENVAVVNISLVGPSNRLLERAVQAMVRRGFLLVAAVGNDGPAAPPLYPAAYNGVVGVTAVSQQRTTLPEAAQGPQVMFAALGAGVAVAEPGGGYTLARGTSFAAPRVAGLLAQHLVTPDAQAAAATLARLISSAVDLGPVGRDPVYGYGLVGSQR